MGQKFSLRSKKRSASDGAASPSRNVNISDSENGILSFVK